MEQPGRTARVRRGSPTVPWVKESNPGLGLQPSGARIASLPSEESPELPGWNVSFPASLITGSWDSLEFQKSRSSKEGFSSGISLPVSKRPTLVAEMSFLPNLHPGGWECGQPSGRAPGAHASPRGTENVSVLQRLRTPSRPPLALPGLLPGQRSRCDPEAGCPQNW